MKGEVAVTSAKLHAACSQMGEARQQLEQAEWCIKQGYLYFVPVFLI